MMTDIVYNKNGIPFDIDTLATDVNGKVDRDLVNCTVPYVVSRTPNSRGGVVEIWSDGYYIETGYKLPNTKTYTISHSIINSSFLSASAINNYNITINIYLNDTTLTVTAHTASGGSYDSWDGYWKVEGYIR